MWLYFNEQLLYSFSERGNIINGCAAAGVITHLLAVTPQCELRPIMLKTGTALVITPYEVLAAM